MKEAQEYLNSKEIHFSQQRIAIMDYLMKHPTHPTVEEIYLALAPQMPTLSRTTVYNTLKLFAEQDAIQVINIEEKNARFDADTMPHAHFFCTECGTIYDVPFAAPEEAISCCTEDNPYLKGFTVRSTQIYYKGICNKCKKE